ncbi:MAG: hypothetical protein ACXVFK_04005 [Solirubrobacteraceae bacterium]
MPGRVTPPGRGCALYPVTIVLLAAALLHERPARPELAALAGLAAILALAGIGGW